MEKHRHSLVKVLSWMLFIIYLIGMFYFLFFSEHYGRMGDMDEYRYNLKLFREIKRILSHYKILGFEFVLVNLFGNVLAFAPFGMFLPIVNKNDDKLLRVLMASFGFSLMVETIQLVYKIGCFDVDDMLLNTIGGVLGLFIFRGIKLFIKRKSKRREICGGRKIVLDLREESTLKKE